MYCRLYLLIGVVCQGRQDSSVTYPTFNIIALWIKVMKIGCCYRNIPMWDRDVRYALYTTHLPEDRGHYSLFQGNSNTPPKTIPIFPQIGFLVRLYDSVRVGRIHSLRTSLTKILFVGILHELPQHIPTYGLLGRVLIVF